MNPVSNRTEHSRLKCQKRFPQKELLHVLAAPGRHFLSMMTKYLNLDFSFLVYIDRTMLIPNRLRICNPPTLTSHTEIAGVCYHCWFQHFNGNCFLIYFFKAFSTLVLGHSQQLRTWYCFCNGPMFGSWYSHWVTLSLILAQGFMSSDFWRISPITHAHTPTRRHT